MNDETLDKVNLFAGKSEGPGDSRTLHAHDEPPALSYKPGAVFTPDSTKKAPEAGGPDSAGAAGGPEAGTISSKLDDIIAKTHDEPIRSAVRTGNEAVDEAAGAFGEGQAGVDQDADDLEVEVVEDKKDDGGDDEKQSEEEDIKVEDESESDAKETKIEVEPKVDEDDATPDKLSEADRSDDDLRQDLADSYSSDREQTVPDMPVQVEATPSSSEDMAADTPEQEDGPKAVRLNNVVVADVRARKPADTEPDNKKTGFPEEKHLSGGHALGDKTTPAAKKAGKKGVRIAAAAIVAMVILGAGSAMAYSPTRDQIVKIFTSGKSETNKNSTPAKEDQKTEQTNSSDYSIENYLGGMEGQKNGNSSGESFNITKRKANYVQSPAKATASKKLTTTNIPTTAAPSVVGSLFDSIPTSQIVSDYSGIEGPCWETVILKDNQPFYNDWCVFGAVYGAQRASNLQILPYTAADKVNFDNVIGYFKSGVDQTIKLESETKIMVGGLEAQKLIFSGASSMENFPDVMVSVDFGRDRYSSDNLKARGFIIAGSYNDDFSKKNFDNALEHWNWK